MVRCPSQKKTYHPPTKKEVAIEHTRSSFWYCLASNQSSDRTEPFSMPIIPANGASSIAGWTRFSHPQLKVRLLSKLALSCTWLQKPAELLQIVAGRKSQPFPIIYTTWLAKKMTFQLSDHLGFPSSEDFGWNLPISMIYAIPPAGPFGVFSACLVQHFLEKLTRTSFWNSKIHVRLEKAEPSCFSKSLRSAIFLKSS